jgi:hypothetical protein
MEPVVTATWVASAPRPSNRPHCEAAKCLHFRGSPLFASFALAGAAAIRSWPSPWWWQLLAAVGVIIGVSFTIL